MSTGKKYYHIQKIVDDKPEWFKGEEYYIDPNELNYFQKNLISNIGDIKTNKKGETGLIKFVEELLKKSNGTLDEIYYHSCYDLLSSLKQSIKWIQEEIFERVRLESYSNCPSRKSSLWMCTYDYLENWIKVIGNKDSRFKQPEIKILSLSVEGVCHEVDATFIDADTYKIADFESVAEKYWGGKQKQGTEIEILFNGHLTVIDEFKSIEEIKYNI